MDPTIVVIGLSHTKAPVEVRERFWMGESRRFECLRELQRSEGIEESFVLATCTRTEFMLWASDFSAAAAAVPKFLTRHYGLRICEWKNFHRLLGDEALRHIFRVTAGLDSRPRGDPQADDEVKSAWLRAQQAGATGRFLDAVLEKALGASKRIRNETEIGAAAVSVPYAAVELARQRTGSLEGRTTLILGAGRMAELSARYLVNSGARVVLATSRTHQHAVNLAERLHSIAIPFEERWQHLEDADLVISCTACPHIVLTREDITRILQAKSEGERLLLIDLAVPRNIDPAVRDLPGISLYNIDDVLQNTAPSDADREAIALAERIIVDEVQGLQRALTSEPRAPALPLTPDRLEQMRRQETEQYKRDYGPLTVSQDRALDELTRSLIQRTAKLLVHQPHGSEEESPRPHSLVSAVRRLAHPQPASPASPRESATQTLSDKS